MIAENLRIVKDSIRCKCAESNRNLSEITLIAVSKNFGIEEIDIAYNEGQSDFGENKAQELLAKYEESANKITWHFIGSLQRNKVKYVVKSAEYIHSVDSLQLASEIGKQAEKLGKVQKILLQLKTSDEETKAGFENENDLIRTAEFCKENKNIELTGLMTIAPYTEDVNLIRKSFRELSNLKESMNKKGFGIKELSMGMTSDYEIAIEEGSTMLRIGSAIFGERDYSKNWSVPKDSPSSNDAGRSQDGKEI